MNPSASILEQLGRQWHWSAHVLTACFDASNNLAFALSDGSVRILSAACDQSLVKTDIHEGTSLSLAAAPDRGFLSGGDDGRFVRINVDGSSQELAVFPGRWIDHVASHPDGIMACSEGKKLHLYSAKHAPLIREFPSTVGGLCFAPNGYRIAVAHYGGVSLCSARSADTQPRVLQYPGSHLNVTWSSNGHFVLSSMQEECIRGWRLEDNDDLVMSGYSTKVKSWSWFNGGRYLATSGARCAPCWMFKNRKSPRGEPPLTPGASAGPLVTTVAGDPRHPVLAMGYEDGQVIIAELHSNREVIIKPPGEGAITTMAWSPDGNWLALGTEEGFAGILPVSA